jgi:hypothetical protein
MAYKRAKFLTLILALTMLSMLFDVAGVIHKSTCAASQDSPEPVQKTDEKYLVGRWIRPDGGYVIELTATGVKGSLKAAYFNPKPINVYRAEIACKKGICTIFVELRDINYPGSKYNLRYDKKNDRLIGTYYQAVAGQTYVVEFLRIK